MRPRAGHPLGWVPAFVAGVVCAVAAEVAIGLLLYAGPGFNRSLTTLLTAEALALAVGFRFPYPPAEIEDGLRRRWLLALVSFLAATVFGTVWTIVPTLGSQGWAQGVGLAVLTGLPLYSAGALLGGLAAEAEEQPTGAQRRIASVALTGAAVGFALTGWLLPRAPTPSSLLVGCLILLSLGGMSYGVLRAGRRRRRLLAEGCAGPPPVRVEEWVAAGDAPVEWVLLEGHTVRARRLPAEDDARTPDERFWNELPWDERLLAELEADGGGPGADVAGEADAPARSPRRALFVGGGASRAPLRALRGGRADEVVVLERQPCVVDLGASHFQTGLAWGVEEADLAPGTPLVHVGNLEDGLRALDGHFDLVVVDGRVLEPVGHVTALSREGHGRLQALVRPDGVIAWGPTASHHPRDLDAAAWAVERRDRRDPLEEVLVARRRAAT